MIIFFIKSNFRFNFRLNMATSSGNKLSDAEWKAKLTDEQFRILRKKDTEHPGTGEYNKHFEAGTYKCAGCGQDLYE
jgi:peptide-methionine (R)-S-oxide reductase